MSFFKVGKLPVESLKRLLDSNPVEDPRVRIGARPGEDAAVIDFGDHYLVVAADPITFTEDRLGWYGVHVNANDVATMGARPKWFFSTLLFPEGKTDIRLVETVFREVSDSCRRLGVTLCGGHTEITAGLQRPILSGQMIGEVPRDRLVDSSRIREGDCILLTKGIAIEGTAILATHRSRELAGVIDSSLLDRAKKFLDDPGISVVDAAMTAVQTARIRGMHDPTEGGLTNGLWELAYSSRKGLVIDEASIPVYPETRAICEVLDLDSRSLIASGALLIVIDPQDKRHVVSVLNEKRIPCVAIGEVRSGPSGVFLLRGGREVLLEPVPRDEIARLMENDSV